MSPPLFSFKTGCDLFGKNAMGATYINFRTTEPQTVGQKHTEAHEQKLQTNYKLV